MLGPRMVVPVQACGDLVTGLWCNRCMLPSAVGLVVIVGMSPQIATECLDCGDRR